MNLHFFAPPENKDLVELEKSRHLIVHSGGVVDHDFREKTGRRDLDIGKPLPLDLERACELANAGIMGGFQLLCWTRGMLYRVFPEPDEIPNIELNQQTWI